jgi:hypothetical protein
MIAHHVGFITAAFVCGSGRILPFPFAWLICGEVSSPFLNLRWYLKLLGGDSLTMKVTNAVFALLFFVSRVVVYGLGLIHLVTHRAIWMGESLNDVPPQLLLLVVSLLFGGYLLNLTWWSTVFRMGMGWKKEQKVE